MARIRSSSAGGDHGASLPYPTSDLIISDQIRSTRGSSNSHARQGPPSSDDAAVHEDLSSGGGAVALPCSDPSILNASTLPPSHPDPSIVKGWSSTEVASTRDDAPVREERDGRAHAAGREPPSDEPASTPRTDGDAAPTHLRFKTQAVEESRLTANSSTSACSGAARSSLPAL